MSCIEAGFETEAVKMASWLRASVICECTTPRGSVSYRRRRRDSLI